MSEASTTTVSTVTVTDPSSIASFNRGPITSIFEQPTSCLATLTLNQNRIDLYWGHYGESYVDSSCYPKPTVPVNNLVTPSSWNSYWYSPAVCPQSWTQATTFATVMPGGDDLTLISLGTDTTAALCCPSGYRYKGSGHICTSDIKQNQVLLYILPTNNGQDFERPTSTTTVASDSSVIGDGVPIWWQSSDSKVLASASTLTPTPTGPTTAPTTAPTTGAQTGPMTSIPSQTSTPPSSGLSTGAKAGIGVAVPLAVIAIAAIAFLLFRRRRKNAVVSGSEAVPGMHSYDPKPPTDAPHDYYSNQHQEPQELYSQPEAYHSRHELPEPGYR
ncbi:hypothetical protein BDV96DRAFT_647582 [Lophiotrema nucula]|uniref:Mid2 domain-containing protein n=1 Tax=Lophiotrema nucula TaxID=690887 RepID=A0A6A5Z4S1_9PLEO|nr:hypothetical protein BDV96DRAFT_647582 [Lophiotrema nucula]